MTIAALTTLAPVFPGYVNVTRQADGQVAVTVRADPKVRKGVHVCGFPADKGKAGRCTPGDERCNNYCNMAPAKGPMADRPTDCIHTDAGATAVTILTAIEWDQLKAALTAV